MSSPKLALNEHMNHKNACCEARMLPLMQRIEQLENRLSSQIERREKDYNDLLRLIVKEKIQTVGGKTVQPFAWSKERKSKVQKRVEKSPDLGSKKQAIKQVLKRRVSARPAVVEKDGLRSQPQKQVPLVASDTVLAMEERTKMVEEGLQHHQSELDKLKELNEQLMDQMLLIFEKIKRLEVKEQATAKQIQSLETISSMVVEGEARQEHIKIVNNLNPTRKTDQPHFQLSQLVSKVSEHDSVLSELIQLTRRMSYHLQSQMQLSPRRQNDV